MKVIIDNLNRKEWALITGDPQELEELDRYFAEQYVYRKLDEMRGSPELIALLGNDPFREQELIDQMINEELAKLKKQGKSRYVQLKRNSSKIFSLSVKSIYPMTPLTAMSKSKYASHCLQSSLYWLKAETVQHRP